MADRAETDLNQRIATRLRDLRAQHGLTLDALAERSGVSRSMISVIERGESSPTAVLLERLASALNVPLAALFDAPGPTNRDPVARRADQAQWRDPASGYVRRNVSPAGFSAPIQIVEVEFPASAQVAFEAASPRDMRVHQQVWVLEGAIDVTVGEELHQLRQGDCLAFVLDRPTAFRNAKRKSARYAVVVASQPERTR
jgi:transcriptional regulator with XRE-family HTH domain